MGEGEGADEQALGASDEPVSFGLVFKGSAREYFRIWIVNLCLTLFTLGIYSAWAKVRKKRYFYSHTELDGVPFQYLAQPLPILKGRLIGAALLALWYGGTHFSKTLLLIVLGVGALLAPWVLVRSAAFNARYSSYRNFTFDFDGSYGAAAGTLVLAGLETVLSCGLGYPWALARVRRFMLTHTSFGGVRGAYTARGGHLIGPYLLLVVSGGLAAAVVGLLTYFHVRGPVGVGLAYVAYGVGYANFQARLANINWRYSSLGPLGFEVVYEGKDFIWLYLTNALAIVGSFGLLAPWASIRMYRYRIERFAVSFHGSTQVFEGQEGAAVRAAGAEVADLFDFDLSL